MGDRVNNLGILYNTVSGDYNLGTYDEFEKKMQDPKNRLAFYNQVGKEYNLGDYSAFEGKILKKKDESVSETHSISPTRLTKPLTVGQEPDKMKGLLVEKPASIFTEDKNAELEADLVAKDGMGKPWKVGVSNMVNAWADAAKLTDYYLHQPSPMMSPSPYSGKFLTTEETKGFIKEKQNLIENPVFGEFMSDIIMKADPTLKASDLPSGDLAKRPDKWYEYFEPRRAYVTLAHNVPLMGSMMAASAINAPMGTMMMMAVEGGQANEQIDKWNKEHPDQKVDADTRAAIVTGVGVVNGLLEKIGIDAVMGKIPGAKGKIAQWLMGSTVEGTTEALQELTQIVGEDVYNKVDEKDWARLWESGSAGLIMGIVGGGVTAANKQIQEIVQAKHNSQNKKLAADRLLLDELKEEKKSKLFEDESYLTKLMDEIPNEYNKSTRKQTAELLAKKDELKEKLDKSSEKLQPIYEKQIKEVDNKLNEVIGIAEGLIEPETQIEKPTASKTKKPTKPLAKEENIVDAPKTINTEVEPKGAEITPIDITKSKLPSLAEINQTEEKYSAEIDEYDRNLAEKIKGRKLTDDEVDDVISQLIRDGKYKEPNDLYAKRDEPFRRAISGFQNGIKQALNGLDPQGVLSVLGLSREKSPTFILGENLERIGNKIKNKDEGFASEIQRAVGESLADSRGLDFDGIMGESSGFSETQKQSFLNEVSDKTKDVLSVILDINNRISQESFAESTTKGDVVQKTTPQSLPEEASPESVKVGNAILEGEDLEEYNNLVSKYGKEKADEMIIPLLGETPQAEPESNMVAREADKRILNKKQNAQEITPPVSPSSPTEVRNVGEQTGEEVYMGDTEKVREEAPQAPEVTLESARSIEELDDLVRAGKITAVNPVYLQKKYEAGKRGWYEKSDVPDEARTMPLSANVTISGKTYTDETQLKVALQNKEISKGDYSSAKASLSKQKFDQAKERLRNSIEGMVTLQAIGDESASLGEVFDSLVEFIKSALDMYGDRIRSARDVAKYTGVAYNKTLQDAYDEAMGKNDVPRERKMRGFPKRIKDFEEFKNIKIDLEQNEELKYTPQSLDDIKDRLSTMNNEELVERVDELTNMRLVDGDDNLAVYAGIELINRYKAEGRDVMPIVERLGRAGTAMGQLIRQYAELKGSTGEGMLSVLEKQLEQQNRYLTPEQKEEFTSLANADIQARAKLKDQAGLTKIDFSKENIAEYDRLKKEAETAYTKMAKYMQSIVPKKFWDMMGMALQGNLLTPMSQITNIYANLMNIPLTASSRVLISPVDAITTGVFGTERVTRLDPKIIVEALKGFGYGVKEAFKQIKTGVDYGKVEQTRGFQPLRALGQAFSNKNMPVNKQGKVEWTDRVNKVVEGLVGLPPETMFRLLNLGDKPFYRMSERVSLYRQGKALRLKGDALEGFIMFPSIKSQKQATKEAQEATFQEESTTAKAAVKATQSIFNMLQGTVLEGPWKFLMRTQMPYVKTPANILSQALDYAVPPLSLGKGLYQMSKGNKQDGLVNIGKAGVGVMMGMAAKVLLDNGLMTGSPEDEKERNLQYDVIPPNSVNLSGIQRMVQGGNPEPQNGDRVINLNKMGITGMVMGIHANVYAARKEMSGKDKELTDNAIKTISTLIEVPAYVLEQSFMRGTSTLISAISDRQWNYWLTNTFNAVSSIPIPNTLSALNRASWEYIPELKGNDFGERLSNVIKAKTFRTEDLPLKINLWGEPIKQTPVGRNAWMYQLLDVTKSQDIQLKPESKFIYDLYNKTQDSRVIPSMPKRKLTINSKQVELDSKDYERFLILVGQARYNQLRNFVGSKAASSMTDEQAVDYIDRLYGIGRDYGKNMFLYEMRLSGRKIE
jgi:hypothetical protein